jgi:FkbM family methyltransferase
LKILLPVFDPLELVIMSFTQELLNTAFRGSALDIYEGEESGFSFAEFSQVFSKKIARYKLQYLDSWLETELHSCFGICLNELSLSKSRDYEIISFENEDLLVLKGEYISRSFANAVRSFFGLSEVCILPIPESAFGNPQAKIETLKNNIQFDDELLDLAYHSRYAKVFFSEEEIERMRSRWTNGNPARGISGSMLSNEPISGTSKSFMQELVSEIEAIDTEYSIGLRDYNIGDLRQFLTFLKNKGLKCRNILDVGANKTDWSAVAKSFFPEANLYMIEPLTEMEPYLKEFCQKHPGSHYFLNGAGSKIARHFLTTWGDELTSASCLVNENEYLKTMDKQREILMITIDSLINEGKMPIPELVKMDVQGFEIEALKGATKLLGQTELFILESSLFKFSQAVPIMSELIQFMTNHGYEIYDFAGYLRRPYDGALGQVDICFAKRDGTLRNINLWAKPTS